MLFRSSFFRGRRSVCTMALGDATNAAPRSAPASAMKLASLRERYVCSSLLLCARTETDGEDAHARSRATTRFPTTKWMHECRLRSLVPFISFRFVRRGSRSSARRRARCGIFPLGNEHRMQNLRRSSLSDGGASASRGLPGTPKNQKRLSVRGGTLEGERMRFRFVMMMRATNGVG